MTDRGKRPSAHAALFAERKAMVRVVIAGRIALTGTMGDPKMDRTTHNPLGSTDLDGDNLLNAVVYGADDAKIGTVAHVHGEGSTAAVIVDAGGFLGTMSKPVAMPLRDLNFMRDERGCVHAKTSWTKDQVSALPEHHH